MKFGINLFPTVGEDEKPADRYFQEALELTELAERLGFHHVKTVEHYFTGYGGYSPDPVTFLAAAAARTSKIRLVTGAVLPAFTHPIKLAGKLAMLDNISLGRLDVGFGRAFLPDEFAAYEVSMDESRPRFDEGIAACRLLWTEKDVIWNGTFHRFGPLTMLPRPYQRPHPRILVTSAVTPETCAAAGRAGYGLMLVPAINKREKLQDMLTLYRKEAAEAGYEPVDEDIHMSYNCYLAPDGEVARTLGRTYSENTNRKLVAAVESWTHTRSDQYQGYEKIVENVRNSDFTKHLTDNKVLVGSPDEVIQRLETIRGWFGDITISLQVITGNMPFAESVRTMELFADHVLPHFS
ncbi:luciferase [Amycolatopsis sp. MJM2582]|uniref:LLM class flavin-dependent oxidoreductase n=1 Tax=Amycolatopsis TaxID=1813 RepID=UPI000502BA4F|nr:MULTISPECIES: LLM class flavin-dependent oxidoreductase [unclassified Amycolatopsis]KFZ76908.1 luciferase [Amycolatopsis sp. MJM2582]RSN39565.1 LLM class flavin-dependent oxidoreductase [Amycolatopsis sp. WAC 04197]